jgi:hypothetical protein
MEQINNILTLAQIQERLHIGTNSVYELAKRKDFPAFKVAGRWLISEDAFNEWVAKQSLGGDAI